MNNEDGELPHESNLCPECEKKEVDEPLCPRCEALVQKIMSELTPKEKQVMLAIAELLWPMHCGSVMDPMGPGKWHCLVCNYILVEDDETGA